jgi:catechol 2,3-dioxygenase-like lactoylglutathione lyase family enzyme
MNLSRIDHVNIVVGDLEVATHFFCRLGFSVTHRGTLEGAWISAIVNLEDVKASYVQLSLEGSETTLELITYHYPPSPGTAAKRRPNDIGIRHIAFAVTDIDALVANLKTRGIDFFGEVQTYPETGKKLVYFHGPDGIILEFAQYPD